MANIELDHEYLCQVEDAYEEGVQAGAQLAYAVFTSSTNIQELARNFIQKYVDWEKLPLPQPVKRPFYVHNYGEEEVQAMEEDGEIEKSPVDNRPLARYGENYNGREVVCSVITALWNAGKIAEAQKILERVLLGSWPDELFQLIEKEVNILIVKENQ